MKQKLSYLFLMNLFISAFTFGGGYVVVPMVRRYFVEKRNYFSEEELINMAAIAQSTPGAIAVNLSALSGYRVAGSPGAVISCIAALLPPILILSVISICYDAFIANAVVAAVLKGMQAGAAACIVDLVIDMCQMIVKKRCAFLSLMIPAAFLANYVLNINVALILAVCCLLCVMRVLHNRALPPGKTA